MNFFDKNIHKYTLYIYLVGQRSIIDFCIFSSELFSSVFDVRVKKGAELCINHHLCLRILRSLNHPKTRIRFRAQRAYRIKWELVADKKVRHTFVSKAAFLLRELPDYIEDVETEWSLFKSTVITSAAASCGCKCVFVHKNPCLEIG